MAKCGFGLAWIGPCQKDVEHEGERCSVHASEKCSSCEKPATRQCDETMGFVCGCPLCDECEHEISPNGTNGRTLNHCKKTDQKYKPWYIQNEQEKAEGEILQAEVDARNKKEMERLIASLPKKA